MKNVPDVRVGSRGCACVVLHADAERDKRGVLVRRGREGGGTARQVKPVALRAALGSRRCRGRKGGDQAGKDGCEQHGLWTLCR